MVASLFACFAAAFAVLIHLITKHFVFDAYVALWGFVAIAFGFASFTWYREVLRKVATDENDRRTGLGPIKWIGLSVLLIAPSRCFTRRRIEATPGARSQSEGLRAPAR